MDIATTEQSLQLLERVNRAIPALLASSDFVGNLETSLRILGETLELNTVFVLASGLIDVKVAKSARDFGTLVALERDADSWKELVHRKEGLDGIELEALVLKRLGKRQVVSGTSSELFTGISPHWEVSPEDHLMLFPLWSNGALRGVLGFGGIDRAMENLQICQSFLQTFTLTLGNWLERDDVFKRMRREKASQYLNIQQGISTRREAEIVKLEREVLFHNLFEKNPLGVVIGDTEGKLLHCNNRFAEMLGYSIEELNQKTFVEITHPEEQDVEIEQVSLAISDQLPLLFMEKRYLHRQGHVIWANVSRSLVYNEDKTLRLAVTMIEDITEKRKIRLKLEQNEAFQKAILTTLPDLKFRISREGRYLDHYPSPNDEQDLLVPPEMFLGRTLQEILPPYLAEAAMANVEKAINTGELCAFEYMLPIRGNISHFEIRINAINEGEVVAVIRNVSERNWAQVELKNKIRELDEKNRQLKDYIDSNMQLENFAYIASHDLREPLRTMGTFAQLLEKRYGDQLDATARTYIDFVVQGARNLNNLIEDLLTYSRIQTQENLREIITLEHLSQEVLDGLKDAIEEQQATITFHQLPLQVQANSSRLKQLMQNLLANAIKFHKQQVPPIVDIYCREEGEHWEFEVRDNGIGIDPEFHEKIFLLFKKLHSRRDFQGTGLGLAICKKVVDQMGGKIWVTSESGKGASFFFTMPK